MFLLHYAVFSYVKQKQLPTIIDASALEQESIYVSAGKRGLSLQLAPDDLAQITHADFRAITEY